MVFWGPKVGGMFSNKIAPKPNTGHYKIKHCPCQARELNVFKKQKLKRHLWIAHYCSARNVRDSEPSNSLDYTEWQGRDSEMIMKNLKTFEQLPYNSC